MTRRPRLRIGALMTGIAALGAVLAVAATLSDLRRLPWALLPSALLMAAITLYGAGAPTRPRWRWLLHLGWLTAAWAGLLVFVAVWIVMAVLLFLDA